MYDARRGSLLLGIRVISEWSACSRVQVNRNKHCASSASPRRFQRQARFERRYLNAENFLHLLAEPANSFQTAGVSHTLLFSSLFIIPIIQRRGNLRRLRESSVS